MPNRHLAIYLSFGHHTNAMSSLLARHATPIESKTNPPFSGYETVAINFLFVLRSVFFERTVTVCIYMFLLYVICYVFLAISSLD